MIIAFTHCSNNFLAQAKTLLASIAKHEKEIKTFFFLADEKDASVNYNDIPAEFNVVGETIVPEFRQLVDRYSLLELNSNLKPFLFQYLLSKHPEASAIYYFDADTVLYNDLSHTNALLNEWNIVITPHFLTPVPDDGLEPFENTALNFGTYNLGFLALNMRSGNTKKFLQWWSDRTLKHGHYDVGNGYFVDQLWFNLVPVYFEKVYSLKHPGYNMAPWNLHERHIKDWNHGSPLLNSNDPLVLYHFSSFDYYRPQLISWKYNRSTFSNTPGLQQLCDEYRAALKKNGIEQYSTIAIKLPVKKAAQPGIIRRILIPVVRLLKGLWRKL